MSPLWMQILPACKQQIWIDPEELQISKSTQCVYDILLQHRQDLYEMRISHGWLQALSLATEVQ
jgi:hypothetical protein